MKIHFFLRFHSKPGQSLSITGSFSSDKEESLVQMAYSNADFWHAVVEVNTGDVDAIRYHYLLTTETGEIIHEAERGRRVEVEHKAGSHVTTIDTWNDQGAYENAFYSTPFKEVLLKRKGDKVKKTEPYTHVFKVKAPLLQDGEVVCLLGENVALGGWSPFKAVVFAREGDWWTQRVNLPAATYPVSYKYGIYNYKKELFVRFEEGQNRIIPDLLEEGNSVIVHDGFVQLPNTIWKGSGVAIPVFSLKSEQSVGIGEFSDLRLLADWAVRTGIKLIQILPINDTTATGTWRDSYPYAAISAFALHPIYINLSNVAGKGFAKRLKAVKEKSKELERFARNRLRSRFKTENDGFA